MENLSGGQSRLLPYAYTPSCIARLPSLYTASHDYRPGRRGPFGQPKMHEFMDISDELVVAAGSHSFEDKLSCPGTAARSENNSNGSRRLQSH